MSELEGKAKRDRSPSYPSIGLGAAVERAAALDEYFKRHPAPLKQLGLAWGMKQGSSQAFSTVAALKSFGLVEYQGSGSELKVVLTEDGRTYLRAQQEEVKQAVLRRLAVLPKAISKYWEIWGSDRPPDPVCLDELVLNAKFSQVGAENFLKVYDSTIAAANLRKSDKIDDSSPATASILSEPKGRIIDVGTGSAPKVRQMEDHLQDVFNVDEGQAVVQWPAGMSADSYADFVAWLDIIKRKIKRQIDAATKPKDGLID
jgi:hypothetical protein